ncbi:cytochrome P450 [Streptantibioticus parmotrematis]|uniref:cytochrome P450 n=1 Tax=Streptantibioticus parmotrematis TaxID=2873249 RepID=UPI0027DF2893|nr:cytochrome P450 [Streptantibioticus parmotrematis]
MIVSLGACNRDTGVFENPGEFCIDRRPKCHLAFGHGPHHCVGMSLARVELQESIGALLRALPGLRSAGEVKWKDQVMRGFRTMPVRW